MAAASNQSLSQSLADPSALKASKRSFVSGIISASADNDPTTVTTLAIAGASALYGLEWLLLLIIPMFTVVQAIGTQLAAVTREGMQAAIRRRYGVSIATLSLVFIVAINVITYAADLDAGAVALQLITHISYLYWLVPISIAVALLLALGTMEKIRGVLIILPLAFIAYAASAFLAHPNWRAVALGFVPHLRNDDAYVATIIALIGTTLTTYSYYWQTVEIAAEAPPKRAIFAVQISALPGTLITGVILWFILIATAATLGVHHQRVETAQDAAEALAPLLGRFASIVFGIGLFGSAMLALPVIAAGTGKATCSTFRWNGSLDKTPREARRFYATIFVAMATGTALALLGISPITLLFGASIAAGFATPLTLGLLVRLASDRTAMGDRAISPALAAAGWCVTAIVTLSALAFIRWH